MSSIPDVSFSEWTLTAVNANQTPTIQYEDGAEHIRGELKFQIFEFIQGDPPTWTYTYESTVTMDRPSQNFVLTWSFGGNTGMIDPAMSLEVFAASGDGTETNYGVFNQMVDSMGHTDDGNAEFDRFVAVTLHKNQKVKIVFTFTPAADVGQGVQAVVGASLEFDDDAVKTVEGINEAMGIISEEEYIAAVENNRNRDTAFIEFWNSSVSVSNMFPAGKDRLKEDMGAFVRMMQMDPTVIRSIIRSEAESSYEQMKDETEKMRDAKIAAGTASVVSGVVGWIPYVGAVAAAAELGVSIGTEIYANKKLALLTELQGEAQDADQWLSSQPDVANGLNLFQELAAAATLREDSDLTTDIVFRSQAQHIMWYLQGLVLLDIEDRTPEEIEADIQEIGAEGTVAYDYAGFLIAWGRQGDVLDGDQDKMIVLLQFLSSFHWIGITLSIARLGRPLTQYLSRKGFRNPLTIAKEAAYKKVVKVKNDLKTRFQRSGPVSQLELGRSNRSVVAAANDAFEAGGNVADAVDNVETKATKFTGVFKTSKKALKQGQKFLSRLETLTVLGGALEIAAANILFDEIQDSNKDIRNSRFEFADEIEEFWLPDDYVRDETDWEPLE